MEWIQEAMRDWYQVLSQVSAALSVPVKGIADWAQLSPLTVFLLGLVGALSPCQLTTNVSALAYVSRRLGTGLVLREAMAYTLGKVTVYMVVGGAVVLLGLKLQQAAIPVVVMSRRVIGPLMVLVGLSLLGRIRLRGSLGSRVVPWLQSRVPESGISGAFSLGVVFSFAFCPTLFWLYFGLMIPLALASAIGWAFPGLFAVGVAFPLLVFASLLCLGVATKDRWLVNGLRRWQGRVTKFSGAIFILLGIHDTLVYWFL